MIYIIDDSGYRVSLLLSRVPVVYIYTYAVCISSMCVPDSARQISAYETKTKE